MQLGEVQSLKEVIAVLEVLGPLAARADDDVDADEGLGQHTAYMLHTLAEEGAVVAAAHQSEHLVAAALQRDVEVGRYALAGGAVVDELVAEEVGLDAADT